MKNQAKNLPFIISLSLLFIYLSPYLLFPQHAHFLIHDNLDSNIVWFKMLAESGLTFSSNHAIFPNVYDGIPRGCMPSELDMYSLFNLVFSPLAAYCVLIVLQHLVAFFGLRLLLKDYLFKGEYPYLTCLTALAYALIPFWPMGQFSVAGQAFVIWALLNLFHDRKTIFNWLIILLYPFCGSDFVFSVSFFLICVLGGIFLLFYNSKKWKMSVLLAWGIIFALSALSQYRLFLLQFADHSFVSQRTVPMAEDFLNWKGYLKITFLLLFKGQYHFYSCQFPILVGTLLLSLFIVRSKKYYFTVAAILLFALCLCAIDNLHTWDHAQFIFRMMGGLSSLQFRFINLLPLTWILLFAVSIYFMVQTNKKLYPVLIGLTGIQIIFLFFSISAGDFMESAFNENAFYYTYIQPNDHSHKTFDAYYNPGMFSNISKDINYKEETVLCIGFPSEIAQYNKFHTAAAYMGLYPAEKKQLLVNIFTPDLKNTMTPAHIQQLVSSRRFQYCDSYNNNSFNSLTLHLDTIALRKLDIKYILTIKPIDNPTYIHLQKADSVINSANQIPQRIFVYRVI